MKFSSKIAIINTERSTIISLKVFERGLKTLKLNYIVKSKMKKKIVSALIILICVLSIKQIIPTYAMYDYPEVYDLYWVNKTARWSVDGWADKYEIRLYRDDRRVFTKTVTSRSRNFVGEMTRGIHEYYFEVRPFNYDTGWGDWEQSDSVIVNKDTNGNTGTVSGGPVGTVYPSSGPGEIASNPTPQQVVNPKGQWMAINGKWHFLYSNGVYASNSWIFINNKWYYVDINTNMTIGLANIGSYTYYFNPDGTMATGTIILNGITHFFDQDGKMIY